MTLAIDMEALRRTVEYEYISTPRSSDCSSAASTPERPSRAEEAFHKSLVGMLNKRGYNVRDSGTFDASETSTASLASTSSASMSSLILSLREPNHGQTPLHIAVRKGDLQVLEALLENDCVDEVINLEDNNGNTALHFAAGSWRRPQCAVMVQGLLEAGADVHHKNKRGLSPLAVHMLTIKVDNASIVVKLLEFGSAPDTEVDGESLLHIAIKHNLPSICGALVAFGASLTALNNEGLMCYEVAPQSVKRAMLRNITKAPPFLPATQRNKCMRCNNALLGAKKLVGNFFKRAVGGRIPSSQCNCYHCGLLFCSQCLKRTSIADSLPPQFVRSRLDDLSSVKTCSYCEAILAERRQRMQARMSLERRNSVLVVSGRKSKHAVAA